MPVSMPLSGCRLSRVPLIALVTVVVAAIFVVAGSRSSWSDTPPHLLAVRSPDAAQAVEAEPQTQQEPEENPPQDNPVPAAPTTVSETAPAKDATPPEKPESAARRRPYRMTRRVAIRFANSPGNMPAGVPPRTASRRPHHLPPVKFTNRSWR